MLPKFFLRLRDTHKKYILQKNWVKTAIPALSSGQNNLQVPIWGCHRQLDDQHRSPNTNNKDHLVGQLTRRHLPCVKGEGEVGASSEGEGEHQSLACQLFAEVKALGGQGGVLSNYWSSHFGELLLKYEIELWYQLNRHVSSSKVSTQLDMTKIQPS